jgi:PGF-CTERM protein
MIVLLAAAGGPASAVVVQPSDSGTADDFGSAPGQTDPVTLSVDDATASAGGTATAQLRLASAPSGFVGYDVTIALADSPAARIDGATAADAFGLTDVRVGPNNETVRLRAVDTTGEVTAGDSNVALAAVDVTGPGTGETELVVTEVERLEDASGDEITRTLDNGTVRFTEDGPSTLRLEPSARTVTTGETRAVDLVLASAPAGVSGFDVTVSTSDSAVATIDPNGTSYGVDTALLAPNVTGDGGVTVATVDGNDQIGPTENPVTLATLAVQTGSAGTARIAVSDATIQTDGGDTIPFVSESATLEVQEGDEGSSGGNGPGIPPGDTSEPTETATQTPTATETVTATATATPSPTATATATVTPTATATATVTPTPTVTATGTPTPTPSETTAQTTTSSRTDTATSTAETGGGGGQQPTTTTSTAGPGFTVVVTLLALLATGLRQRR